MFTAALDGLVSQFGLQGEQLSMVAGGAVPNTRDFNLIRESVLGFGPVAITPRLRRPAGMRHRPAGHHRGRRRCRAAATTWPSAGGVDTTSDAPIAVSGSRCAVSCSGQPLTQHTDQVLNALKLLPNLGIEIRAAESPHRHVDGRPPPSPPRFGVKRADQDELAAASHQKMAAAYDSSFFDDLIPPFGGLVRDQNLRGDSTAEKLAKLKPVFGVSLGDATTAGATPPRSPTARRQCCWHRRVGPGQRSACARVLRRQETAAVDYVNGPTAC